MGTFTNITARHPNKTVRAPPATDPTANPAETTAMKIPMYLFLSFPSRNKPMKIANAVTVDMAAPIPCTARKTMSRRSDGARPAAKEAMVKTTIPPMNIFFWP